MVANVEKDRNRKTRKVRNMFCWQCEQTSKGQACTVLSVCGKDETTAILQDLLVHAVKGISKYAHRARQLQVKDNSIDVFVTEALFTTVTNVNFDPLRMQNWLIRAGKMMDKARKLYENARVSNNLPLEDFNGATKWKPAPDINGLVAQGREVSIETRKQRFGDDICGLQELLLYGVKGTAAYAEHARILGHESDEVYAFFHEALDYLTNENPTVDELFRLCMKCGEINLKTMEMLSQAHTSTYGDPVPTKVRTTPIKGKAILISGHDLKDLEELLKQTEGKGINIYTHGEMLPAHGYPKLKAYKHLVGNYGGAWQDQKDEFAAFPGAILMTTNCIQEPQPSYRHRIFTSGLVAWPGIYHISNRDFTPVIEAALKEPGFTQDEPEQYTMTGFGHNAVLSIADKVIEAVRKGEIRRFFLIGGCDGAKPGRNYYTELAQSLPKDCVILTLACGKYRFNKLDFGAVDGGLPRFMDIGQCNDAYSAIRIAQALAGAFNCGVNDLPLSLILSWYEQKAVAILLTLLYLGIKNIRIGPSLPAFISPNVLKVLVENFSLKPITTPAKDLAEILGTSC